MCFQGDELLPRVLKQVLWISSSSLSIKPQIKTSNKQTPTPNQSLGKHDKSQKDKDTKIKAQNKTNKQKTSTPVPPPPSPSKPQNGIPCSARMLLLRSGSPLTWRIRYIKGLSSLRGGWFPAAHAAHRALSTDTRPDCILSLLFASFSWRCTAVSLTFWLMLCLSTWVSGRINYIGHGEGVHQNFLGVGTGV